jgi:(2Fe-2S) ferredoxin
MKKYRKEVSTNFIIEGQFLGFVIDEYENKFKYLRMVVADDEVQIKLSKQARASLFRVMEQNSFIGLRPWDLIQVAGEKTFDRTSGELRFRAEEIKLLGVNKGTPIQPETDVTCQTTTPCPATTKLSTSKSSAKLLVCHRSSCQKRGGRRQHQAIENMLRDRGLHDRVSIQKSGCLGKCSQAPNIVLMPGKKRLSGMHPEAIAELLANLRSNN